MTFGGKIFLFSINFADVWVDGVGSVGFSGESNGIVVGGIER